MFEALNNTKVN